MPSMTYMRLFSVCVVDVTETQDIKPAADEDSAVRAVECWRRRADSKIDQRQKYVVIIFCEEKKNVHFALEIRVAVDV